MNNSTFTFTLFTKIGFENLVLVLYRWGHTRSSFAEYSSGLRFVIIEYDEQIGSIPNTEVKLKTRFEKVS